MAVYLSACMIAIDNNIDAVYVGVPTYTVSMTIAIMQADRYCARNFGHVANFCTNIAGLI